VNARGLHIVVVGWVETAKTQHKAHATSYVLGLRFA
jgi:hypothetical protein